MSKQIFIKNTGQYHLTCTPTEKIKTTRPGGAEVMVDKKLFTITFESRTTDPDNGSVVHTGYKAISPEQFKSLVDGCWIFRDAIKKGGLVKYENAPKDALLDSQLLDSLANENRELKRKVKELEKRLLDGAKKDESEEEDEAQPPAKTKPAKDKPAKDKPAKDKPAKDKPAADAPDTDELDF